MARHFTAEEILQTLPRNREFLRKDFADSEWMAPLDAMTGELLELAATPDRDIARVADLERRLTRFIRERKAKGLDPLLWMVASLKPAVVRTQ